MPTIILGPIVELYRAQSAGHDSPWHFACTATAGFGGRFHLPCDTGRGTSYWAGSPVGAILEAVADPDAVDPIVVTIDALAALAIWKVAVLPDGKSTELADLTAPSAVPRLTGEISTTHDYGVTQQWAVEFAAVGRGGVAYTARFANEHAVALFAGADTRPTGRDTRVTRGIDHWSELPPLLRAGTGEVGDLDSFPRGPAPDDV